MLRYAITGVVAVALLVGCASTGPTDAPATPLQFSAQGRWWTWAAAEAGETNPVADQSGEFCARNQPEDVWFLAGTFGGTIKRTCAIPEPRKLVVPLVNQYTDRPEDCYDMLDTAKGTAVLDGETLSYEEERPEPIIIGGVEGNPVTGTARTIEAYACGLWLRTDEVPAGTHTLEIRGSFEGFATGVDYTLRVAESP